MAIQVAWANDKKTLIQATFQNGWDWYEFYAAAGKIVRLMTTVGHPVDVLMDLRASKPAPEDFAIHSRRASYNRRNIGAIVLVQPGSALKRLTSPLRNLTPDPKSHVEMFYAATIEEAESLLAAHRAAREARRAASRHGLRFLTR